MRIEWNTPVSDWDMLIYRADGSGHATGDPIGSSQQGTTDFEETTVTEPFLPSRFVVRVVNFAAVAPADSWTGRVTFGGPQGFTPAKTENWTLTCEGRGRAGVRRQILIKRGEARSLDLSKRPRGLRVGAEGDQGQARRARSFSAAAASASAA